MYTNENLETLATQIRLEVIKIWSRNRAPISGALGIVDVYVVLFFKVLDIDQWVTNDIGRTRILPKTTAANALYGTLKYAGLLETANSEGDPVFLPPVVHKDAWVGDISGTLTRNIDQAIGLAFYAKYNGNNNNVIAFISEGDLQAGVDHRAKLAAAWGLTNLALILDYNQVQSAYDVTIVDPTLVPDSHGRLPRLKSIWENYGWEYVELDGHNYADIEHGLRKIGKTQKPLIIVARTTKGKGVPFIEKDPVRYSHKFSPEEFEQATSHLEKMITSRVNDGRSIMLSLPVRHVTPATSNTNLRLPSLSFDADDQPRQVLRDWLAQFRDLNPQKVFIINSDNPTPFDPSQVVYSARNKTQHLQVGVNEKVALNIARGIANAGGVPIYTAPATHMQVCAEDLMHCAIDKDPVLLVGVRPGSDIAHWGATHNSTRDTLLFSFPGVTVFQPATAEDTSMILDTIYGSADKYLPAYLRITREVFVYDQELDMPRVGFEDGFQNGFYYFGSEDFGSSDVVFVTSGSVLRECMMAARSLKEAGIRANVVNVLNLSSIDANKINMLVGKTALVVSATDADSSTLADLLWKTLAPAQRHKVIDKGVNDFSETHYTRDEIFQRHGINSENLVELVVASLAKEKEPIPTIL
jgi:transketolase